MVMLGSTGVQGQTGRATPMSMSGGNIIPKGYRQGRMAQFTPEQANLFQQMFSQVSPESFLSRLAGGDQGMFEQLEAPAHRQFQEKLGQIGSRFSQLAPGAMSAQRGSGFQQATSQAASDFAERLQAQRLGLQHQALRDLMDISQHLLGQHPYEEFLFPRKQKKHSWLGSILPFAGAGLGAGLGAFGGAPLLGAKLGGTLGGMASKAFF